MATITIDLNGLTPQQEQQLLLYYTDAQGYDQAVIDEPTLTRVQFAKRRIVHHLLIVARDEFKKQEATTAKATAQQTFENGIQSIVEGSN